MKFILRFNLVIIFIMILYSCSNKEPLIGVWSDNIKLSSKSAEFSASGDSVTIKTKGISWVISDISVDTIYFYNFKDIDMSTDNYYVIKQNCFDVEHRNNNTLFIKVDANLLNVKRIITVGLQAGDYFDRVTITQKSK